MGLRTRTSRWLRTALVAAAAAAPLALPAQTTAPAGPLPDRLSDAEFRTMVDTFSEAAGAFHSDNFTSNEPFGDNAAPLAGGRRGGAYLGVGPEQNFSYIVAVRPSIAFIVDIRRQAVMQHLMFKALFELSEDRADFLARLFSKPRPAGEADRPLEDIWSDLGTVPATDETRFETNLAEVRRQLEKTHALVLAEDDWSLLAYVYRAFLALGPAINYAGYREGLTTGNLDFAKLSLSVDRSGVRRSFLASEESFQYVQSLQARNLIVPVQADFAGPTTLRKIGDYLRSHGAVVTAFYISNVEQYLFGMSSARETDVNGGWKAFYDNLAALPTDSSSVLVRALTGLPGGGRRGGSPSPPAICPVSKFLQEYAAGRITGLAEARQCGQ